MSIEGLFRKQSRLMDHSELREEFGLDHEQASELHVRVARAMWLGFQIGSFVTFGVILMVLGGFALYRFFCR